jgi:hypothetical protein
LTANYGGPGVPESQVQGAASKLATTWFTQTTLFSMAPSSNMFYFEIPFEHIYALVFLYLMKASVVSWMGTSRLYGHAVDMVQVKNGGFGGTEVLYITSGSTPRLLRVLMSLNSEDQQRLGASSIIFSWPANTTVNVPFPLGTVCSVYDAEFSLGFIALRSTADYESCPGYVPTTLPGQQNQITRGDESRAVPARDDQSSDSCFSCLTE